MIMIRQVQDIQRCMGIRGGSNSLAGEGDTLSVVIAVAPDFKLQVTSIAVEGRGSKLIGAVQGQGEITMINLEIADLHRAANQGAACGGIPEADFHIAAVVDGRVITFGQIALIGEAGAQSAFHDGRFIARLGCGTHDAEQERCQHQGCDDQSFMFHDRSSLKMN